MRLIETLDDGNNIIEDGEFFVVIDRKPVVLRLGQYGPLDARLDGDDIWVRLPGEYHDIELRRGEDLDRARWRRRRNILRALQALGALTEK